MKWTQPALPRTVVQGIPVDGTGHALVMHRSNKVRSARNVWSFPSGLQKIGESVRECMHRELLEEYGLVGQNQCLLGLYENIAGDADAEEQSHWVIVVVGIRVADLSQAINKEPDKHDLMKVIGAAQLSTDQFYDDHPFHPSFNAWARANKEGIFNKLRILTLD